MLIYNDFIFEIIKTIAIKVPVNYFLLIYHNYCIKADFALQKTPILKEIAL